ncbi:MAG: transposase family protein [Rhodopseudomonas palustris]|nr:transposase family protein [Rhodopseudomonas palustris]
MEMFITSFAQVPDPRAGNARHDLVELLFNAFVAVLCGAKTCFEMAEFGRAKTSFFKNVLGLAHGVRRHDTSRPCSGCWAPKAFGATPAPCSRRCEVVVIDEKAVKHVYEAGKAHAPKMMASAFAAELHMTLSCLAAKDGDEVSAALEVLGFVDLTGKIVTDLPVCAALPPTHGGWCRRPGRRLLPRFEGQSGFTAAQRCRRLLPEDQDNPSHLPKQPRGRWR